MLLTVLCLSFSSTLLQSNPSHLQAELTPPSHSGQRVLDELNQSHSEAIQAWEAGGDSAVTIATLRTIASTSPETSAYSAFDLGRVLQTEGRVSEAAEWFWISCHTPNRRGAKFNKNPSTPVSTRNSFKGSPYSLARIADCLEDAGHLQDAKWVMREAEAGNRKELYVSNLRGISGHPDWLRKWAMKAMKDYPKDQEVRRQVDHLTKTVGVWTSQPEKFPIHRDLPK